MISDLRAQGFTISHSVPQGLMLPGKGSVISLSGKSFDEVLLKENTSLFSQLKGARRMFPATTIGVMSKFRDLYRQGEYSSTYEKKYASNSKGQKRPNYDAATKGMYPAVTKQIPVFFRAESALDAFRVMALQKDLGFNLVLSELKQGSKLISKMRPGTKALLSLELPKKSDEKKKEDKEKISEKKEGAEEKKEAAKEKIKEKKKEKLDPEKEALKKRTDASKKEYVSQAAMFEKNNVPFAFSFLEVKTKDIKGNLTRMVKAGLSEKEALEALTTEAAKTLGIANLAGSIEAGKLGNVVVCNKPFFDEKSKIKYVFVEGQKFEFEIKEKKKKAGTGEASDLTGSYTYEIEIPNMTRSGNMKIKKTDDQYTVSVSQEEAPDDYEEIEGVEQNGNNLSFSFPVENEGFIMTVEMDIDFEGDDFEGTVSVSSFGSFPVTGSKTSPNQNQK